MIYYTNKETGELLTENETRMQAIEWYDIGDPTNIFTLDDYFDRVELPDFNTQQIKNDLIETIKAMEFNY